MQLQVEKTVNPLLGGPGQEKQNRLDIPDTWQRFPPTLLSFCELHRGLGFQQNTSLGLETSDPISAQLSGLPFGLQPTLKSPFLVKPSQISTTLVA